MKDYFKYIFIDSLQWLWISIPSIICIGAAVHTKDIAALIFLIPTAAMVWRSVKMYKEKKDGTTS